MFLTESVNPRSNVLLESDFTKFYQTLAECSEEYNDLALKMVRYEHTASVTNNTTLYNESVKQFGNKVKDVLVRIWESIKRMVFKFINFVRSKVMIARYQTKLTTTDVARFKKTTITVSAGRWNEYMLYISTATDIKKATSTFSAEAGKAANISKSDIDKASDILKTAAEAVSDISQYFREGGDVSAFKSAGVIKFTPAAPGTEKPLTQDMLSKSIQTLASAKTTINAINALYKYAQIIYESSKKSGKTSKALTAIARGIGGTLKIYNAVLNNAMYMVRTSKLQPKKK